MGKLVTSGVKGYGYQVEGLPQALVITSTQNSVKQVVTGFLVVAIGFLVVTTGFPGSLQETQLKVVGRQGR